MDVFKTALWQIYNACAECSNFPDFVFNHHQNLLSLFLSSVLKSQLNHSGPTRLSQTVARLHIVAQIDPLAAKNSL